MVLYVISFVIGLCVMWQLGRFYKNTYDKMAKLREENLRLHEKLVDLSVELETVNEQLLWEGPHKPTVGFDYMPRFGLTPEVRRKKLVDKLNTQGKPEWLD